MIQQKRDDDGIKIVLPRWAFLLLLPGLLGGGVIGSKVVDRATHAEDDRPSASLEAWRAVTDLRIEALEKDTAAKERLREEVSGLRVDVAGLRAELRTFVDTLTEPDGRRGRDRDRDRDDDGDRRRGR